MQEVPDLKVHVRSANDANFKHFFIAEFIASYSDILDAIYERYGKDVNILKIYYKG